MVHQTEKHHHRQTRNPRLFDGYFQGVVILGSEGRLHPVKNKIPGNFAFPVHFGDPFFFHAEHIPKVYTLVPNRQGLYSVLVMKKAAVPRILAGIPAIIGAMTLFGCSQTIPAITQVSLRLVYQEKDTGIKESFSLFVSPQDNDGNADLGELDLIDDEAQLIWTLTDTQWVRVENSGQTWIGSHNLQGPGDQNLPRGKFRVVLVDKGGNRSERTVVFDGKERPVYSFPRLQWDRRGYAIRSAYPKNSLLFYDKTGKRITVLPVTNLSGTLESLRFPPEAQSVALWAEDTALFIGALTKPVPFP